MSDMKDSVKLKEIPYSKTLKDAMNQIPKGSFLTVKKNDEVNTMTIGWATAGVMWGRPVFVIGVRPSRYTYSFLEIGSEFSISVPLNQKLKKELGFCGSHSGKTINKFEECAISSHEGFKVKVPFVKECGLHFECRVVAKHQLIKEYMDETIIARHYPEDDYHMIFYGEIISCFKTE
jgi:flavin reductase (DIM6/NTAB) family NADH-FMN oxidoreductase RutF